MSNVKKFSRKFYVAILIVLIIGMVFRLTIATTTINNNGITTPSVTVTGLGSLNATSLYCVNITELTSGQGVNVVDLIVQSVNTFSGLENETDQMVWRYDQGLLYVYNNSWIPVGSQYQTQFLPFANITSLPNYWPMYVAWANLTGLPSSWTGYCAWANLTGVPSYWPNYVAWANLTSVPSSWPGYCAYANLTGVPQTFPYANLTGTPSTFPYANLTGVPVLLYASGSQPLTGNWNLGGSYGIYGATWLNSTSISTTYLYLGSLTNNPASPIAGEIWFRSDIGQFYGYNGSATIALGGVGATGPAGPVGNVTGLPYTFLVFQNTTSNYLINCTTGSIAYSNTNASIVINFAYGNCSGTYPQTVYLRGNFSITDTILPASWTTTILDGSVTLSDTGQKHVFNSANKTHITVTGGYWVGSAPTQPQSAIYQTVLSFSNTTYIDVSHCDISEGKYFDIFCVACNYTHFSELTLHDSACAIGLTQGDNATLTDITDWNITVPWEGVTDAVWINNNDTVVNGLVSSNVGDAIRVEANGQNTARVQVTNVEDQIGDSTNYTDGICIDSVGSAVLSSCDFSNIDVHNVSQYGIECYGGAVNGIRELRLTNFGVQYVINSSYSGSLFGGLFVQNTAASTFSNGVIDTVNCSGSPIAVSFGNCQNITVNSLTVMNEPSGDGIYFANVQNSTVEGCTTMNCANPYSEAPGCAYNLIADNNFAGTGFSKGTWWLGNDTDYVYQNVGWNPIGYYSGGNIGGASSNLLVDYGVSNTYVSGTTYTCWQSPKEIIITGGTVTAIVMDGQTLFSSATTISLYLMPGDSFSITASSMPTIKVFDK